MEKNTFACRATKFLCGRNHAVTLMTALLLFTAVCTSGIFLARQARVLRGQISKSLIVERFTPETDSSSKLREISANVGPFLNYLGATGAAAENWEMTPLGQLEQFTALSRTASSCEARLIKFSYDGEQSRLDVIFEGWDSGEVLRKLHSEKVFLKEEFSSGRMCNTPQFTISCYVNPPF